MAEYCKLYLLAQKIMTSAHTHKPLHLFSDICIGPKPLVYSWCSSNMKRRRFSFFFKPVYAKHPLGSGKLYFNGKKRPKTSLIITNIYTCHCLSFNELLLSNFADEEICLHEMRCLAILQINKCHDWSTLCSIDILKWWRQLMSWQKMSI